MTFVIVLRERWIPIEIPDLAIIDHETFHAASKRLVRNKLLAKRNRKNTYLLSGFFRCSGCGATMIGHVRHYESGLSAKYYRCGNHWKQFKGEEKCGFKAIDTVAHKVDDAVWSWLKNLLCDADALETGLNELIENRSNEISPKLNRLKTIEGLIKEEETKIRRLISQMSHHDDEIIIVAFRSELEQASQNSGALIEERNKLADELDHLHEPNDQRE